MTHFIAGLSKRQSNRLLAASREQDSNECPQPPKVSRSNDVGDNGESQSVSVTINSSRPVRVHVELSADLSCDPSPPIYDAVIAIDDGIAHPDNQDTYSDESDDECEDRDPHLHLVRESDLIGIDVTDCAEEVDEVEFIYRKTEAEAVTKLRIWALTNRITRNALDALLLTLREVHGPIYPKCAKTLLRTPREPTIAIPMTPGHYYHLGINLGMLSYPKEELLKLNSVFIDIATDGFQFASSSKIVGWPIFGSIVGLELCPFIIGIYIGKTKPDTIDDFMLPFLQEYQNILNDGGIRVPLDDGFHLISIKVRLFVTDTPARCFVVSTHYHTHSFGCHRCNAKMVRRNFPSTKGETRTDQTFADRTHSDHHSTEHKVKYSALERYGFLMISQFPLDVMHLVDLGIGKLIVSSIMNDVKNQISELLFPAPPSGISASQYRKSMRAVMSKRHGELKNNAPQVFARTPRPLNECKLFKATEFRQFILYTGIVIMKEFLSKEAYQHFLCLSLGYRVLFSTILNEKKLDAAQTLLEMFVKDFTKFYKRNVSYNVHSLLHLVDDARLFGRVDCFSAYQYENSIRKLQLLVRSNSQIFSQIRNRLEERRIAGVLQGEGSLKFINLSLPKNRYHRVSSDNGSTFKYISIISVLKCKTKCKVRFYLKISEYFDTPLSSIACGIVLVDDMDLGEVEELAIDELSQMCYGVPTDNNTIVLIPLAHL